MRVLGIDPGLRITGYGCVEDPPASPRGSPRASLRPRLIEAGVIRLNAKRSVADRLCELETDLDALLDRLKPDAVAVEMLYAHYAHPTTAIIMGHARGVMLLAIRKRSLTLVELRATAIKKSLVGNGHASKPQMQEGVRVELNLTTKPDPPDVADALAIALCALRRVPRV